MINLAFKSVGNMPGAIAFTFTPVFASSTASTFVSDPTAAFDAEYAATWKNPTNVVSDAILMIRPYPALHHRLPQNLAGPQRSRQVRLDHARPICFRRLQRRQPCRSRPPHSPGCPLCRIPAAPHHAAPAAKPIEHVAGYAQGAPAHASISAAAFSTCSARRELGTTSAPASANPTRNGMSDSRCPPGHHCNSATSNRKGSDSSNFPRVTPSSPRPTLPASIRVISPAPQNLSRAPRLPSRGSQAPLLQRYGAAPCLRNALQCHWTRIMEPILFRIRIAAGIVSAWAKSCCASTPAKAAFTPRVNSRFGRAAANTTSRGVCAVASAYAPPLPPRWPTTRLAGSLKTDPPGRRRHFPSPLGPF